MKVIKKCIEMAGNLAKKTMFYIKLKHMDAEWYDRGGSCWELFPPSFYYTHTKEEIKRITAEAKVRIQTLIDLLGD